MPIRYSIDIDKRLIQTTASGRVGYADLFEYFRTLPGHPKFANDLRIIFDTTLAAGFDLEFDDVRRLSSLTEAFARLDPPLKVAIVAPGDLAFGMSRMYEMLKSESSSAVKVFRDRSAAEAWLFGGTVDADDV